VSEQSTNWSVVRSGRSACDNQKPIVRLRRKQSLTTVVPSRKSSAPHGMIDFISDLSVPERDFRHRPPRASAIAARNEFNRVGVLMLDEPDALLCRVQFARD
jgi:hypothetical protein